jgi:uncharacterized membrane protein
VRSRGCIDDVAGARHGYLLSGGSFTTIDVPGATLTAVFGLNDLGDVVGSYIDADRARHGFLLSGGNYTTIDVDVPNATNNYATGINDAGQISGKFDVDGTTRGFLAIPTPEP